MQSTVARPWQSVVNWLPDSLNPPVQWIALSWGNVEFHFYFFFSPERWFKQITMLILASLPTSCSLWFTTLLQWAEVLMVFTYLHRHTHTHTKRFLLIFHVCFVLSGLYYLSKCQSPSSSSNNAFFEQLVQPQCGTWHLWYKQNLNLILS